MRKIKEYMDKRQNRKMVKADYGQKGAEWRNGVSQDTFTNINNKVVSSEMVEISFSYNVQKLNMAL